MLMQFLANHPREAAIFRPLATRSEWESNPEKALIHCMRRSGIVDSNRYLADYPDVGKSGWDAIDHFVMHGIEEKRRIYRKDVRQPLFETPSPNFRHLFSKTPSRMDTCAPLQLLFICKPLTVQDTIVTVNSCIRNTRANCACHIIALGCGSSLLENFALPETWNVECHVYECQVKETEIADVLFMAHEILPDVNIALYVESGTLIIDDPQDFFNPDLPPMPLIFIGASRQETAACAILNMNSIRLCGKSDNSRQKLSIASAKMDSPLIAAARNVNSADDLNGKILVQGFEDASNYAGRLWEKEITRINECYLDEIPQDSRELLKKFIEYPVRGNSVLIVETMECHGELIPGVALHFLKAGWHVDLLLRSDNFFKHPFSRIFNEKMNIFHNSADYMSAMLDAAKLDAYKLIVFTSKVVYIKNPEFPNPTSFDWPTIYDAYPQLLPLRNKIIHFQHHLERLFEDGNDSSLILANPANEEKMISKVANLCEFGDVDTQRPKNGITTFICVGDIKPERRNHALLLAASIKAARITKKFRLVIIARYGNLHIPAELERFIEFHSNADFETLYTSLENADFILPMLDAENPAHQRYLKGATSGTFQLVYGFHKPALIDRAFAGHYFLNESNAIVYSGNGDFFNAFLKAISMNKAEYSKLQKSLASTQQTILRDSEKNLDALLQKLALS